jgi:virginiamycin B lyase
MIAGVSALSLSPAPAWAAAGTVTEFPLGSSPVGITAGPDGALWFTECALASTGNCTANGTIGRLTTDGAVTNDTDPNISGPVGIAAGPDGALWFTALFNFGHSNSIGRITTQ